MLWRRPIDAQLGSWQRRLLPPGQLLELRQPALPGLEIGRQVLLLLEPLGGLQVHATVQGLRLEPCGFVRRVAADGAPADRAQGCQERAEDAAAPPPPSAPAAVPPAPSKRLPRLPQKLPPGSPPPVG